MRILNTDILATSAGFNKIKTIDPFPETRGSRKQPGPAFHAKTNVPRNQVPRNNLPPQHRGLVTKLCSFSFSGNVAVISETEEGATPANSFGVVSGPFHARTRTET